MSQLVERGKYEGTLNIANFRILFTDREHSFPIQIWCVAPRAPYNAERHRGNHDPRLRSALERADPAGPERDQIWG